MQMKNSLVQGMRVVIHVVTLLVIGLILMPWTAPRAFAQNQSGITSPASGATISGNEPIVGTAVIEPFQKYELAYKLEPSGNDAYVYFGGGTSQVVNAQLGTWQAAGLTPGVYSIRLRVVKADGNYAEFFAQNLSVNQQPAAPTATPTSSTPTVTPIPTATFTPGPQPTVAVGQVTQPQVETDQASPTVTVSSIITTGAGQNTNSDSGAALALAPAANNNAQVNAQNSTGNSTNLSRQLGEKLSMNNLRTRFFTGVRLSAALFFAAFALFAGKRIFGWAWARYR
jgi:hypothetical protein